MDLVPKPGQVVAAAGNVAQMALYGGLADLRPMPRSLIDEGELRELYHYRARAGVPEQGDPVLLVTPLAAPATCYDLRRDCSLVEHLVDQGRPTYLVEYGNVSFRQRSLGLEHWVQGAVPEAIERVSEHAGGRPVHVIGWSLGGIFALLTAADRPDLPIASLTALGTPFDVRKVPLVAPMRPLLNITAGGAPITRIYRSLGGVPTPLVRWVYQLTSFEKLVTKPLALAQNLDDADFLAQIEAVDRFVSNMTAYPGRTFGQLYHRFIRANSLVTGEMELDGRTLSVADIEAPVLVFAGQTDGIAPVPAVRHLVPLLTGSEEVRFEVVPGGHLGMLTGRRARGTTWQVIDEWIDQWSGRAPAKATAKKRAAGRSPAKKTPAKKPPATKAPAKKRAPKNEAARKAPAKKAAAKKAAAPATSEAIGVNPRRRYGSGGSRSLAR